MIKRQSGPNASPGPVPEGAPILHINGWAGSGKRTIAARLAELTSTRLIDNHALLNPVQALYERSDPRAPGFRQSLRDLVFAELHNLPQNTKLIFTDALADDAYCRGLFQDVIKLAKSRRAPLTAINLSVAEPENIRRLTDPSRAPLRKLRDPETLRHLRQTETLLSGLADQTRTLDVTDLSADQASHQLRTLWLSPNA